MFGNPIGAKGAQKHDASATPRTGSFLAIQAIASSSLLNVPNSPIHAGKGYIGATGSFAKFSSITWGNAKEVNEGNYSGSANNSTNLQSATNVVLMGGERIEGPIYAFTMTTGSCLTYMF
tara:strand:+ start:1189 stop:1548 length:360 start_codon:yes stop_codon:yes gene_type:complete